MTEPTDAPNAAPEPLWGLLQPGERTTRVFSAPLQGTYVPLLQRIPHSGVRIAEQSDHDITLENTGSSMSPYLVLFPTQALLRAAAAGKELVGYFSGLRGKK